MDGQTLYSISTFDKKEVLDFLRKYDHEGSSIELKTFHPNGYYVSIEVYEFLTAEIEIVKAEP